MRDEVKFGRKLNLTQHQRREAITRRDKVENVSPEVGYTVGSSRLAAANQAHGSVLFSRV